ncbi:MAG: hypothetical protein ABMA64_06730 [Myxococcota bacterium]
MTGVLSMVASAAFAMNPEFPETGVCEYPHSLTFPVWDGDVTQADGSTEPWTRAGCGGAWLGDGWFATAAHCVDPGWIYGEQLDQARFGNHTDREDFEWDGGVLFCESYPGGFWDEAHELYAGPDLAVCKLAGVAADWPEMPTVPILVPNSCENDYIRHLAFGVASANDNDAFPWTPYGFGVAPVPIAVPGHGFETKASVIGGEECNLRFADCPVGNRRVADSFLFSEITTVVDGLPTRTVPFIHRTFSDPVYGPELDAWNTWPSDSIADDGVLNGGDSGSPMYFRMADDTWRLLGVASTNIFSRTLPTWHIYETGKVVNSPYAVTTFAPLPVYLPWIEDVIEAYDPDVDLTPCHTFINVGGVKEYQYLATQDCEDAIAARALDLDANAVAWSDGCDLPAGGDDSSTTGACAGWEEELPVASPSAPTTAGSYLSFALTGIAPDPVEALLDLPPGTPYWGTGLADILTVATVDALTTVDLGEGNDQLVVIRTGSGIGAAEVVAGWGDDVVTSTGSSNDLVFPGLGKDTVSTGDGTDTVVIFGGCELKAGESLVGGNGTDTLVSPLDPCQLALRDVAATGFESWKKTNARADTAVCTTAATYPPLSTDTSAAHKALVATACAKRW